MPSFILAALPRILGWLVATLCTFLATKYDIIIPENAQHQVTAYGVGVIVAMWGGIYAITHRSASSKWNPTDAATKELAEVGKSDQLIAKSARR